MVVDADLLYFLYFYIFSDCDIFVVLRFSLAMLAENAPPIIVCGQYYYMLYTKSLWDKTSTPTR